MSKIEPMTASEICYAYGSILEDAVRDRLWGQVSARRGEVKAIMAVLGLSRDWDECRRPTYDFREFVERFVERPEQRKEILRRCSTIERLDKEWKDFYYGLERVVKAEGEAR